MESQSTRRAPEHVSLRRWSSGRLDTKKIITGLQHSRSKASICVVVMASTKPFVAIKVLDVGSTSGPDLARKVHGDLKSGCVLILTLYIRVSGDAPIGFEPVA
jgi:hypothetical protein